MNLETLNTMSQSEAFYAFEKCCASTTWVNRMVDSIPFASEAELMEKATAHWSDITFSDWLEACDGHPKIGNVDSLKAKYSSTHQWAGNEQKGMEQASDYVIERLAEGNEAYEDRFGYLFIVCATGKSAAEMLHLLEQRLENDADDELDIAKAEQLKITHIRLKKLLETT